MHYVAGIVIMLIAFLLAKIYFTIGGDIVTYFSEQSRHSDSLFGKIACGAAAGAVFGAAFGFIPVSLLIGLGDLSDPFFWPRMTDLLRVNLETYGYLKFYIFTCVACAVIGALNHLPEDIRKR